MLLSEEVTVGSATSVPPPSPEATKLDAIYWDINAVLAVLAVLALLPAAPESFTICQLAAPGAESWTSCAIARPSSVPPAKA